MRRRYVSGWKRLTRMRSFLVHQIQLDTSSGEWHSRFLISRIIFSPPIISGRPEARASRWNEKCSWTALPNDSAGTSSSWYLDPAFPISEARSSWSAAHEFLRMPVLIAGTRRCAWKARLLEEEWSSFAQRPCELRHYILRSFFAWRASSY